MMEDDDIIILLLLMMKKERNELSQNDMEANVHGVYEMNRRVTNDLFFTNEMVRKF